MPLPTDSKTLLSLLRFQYYEMHEVPSAVLYYSPTATKKHTKHRLSALCKLSLHCSSKENKDAETHASTDEQIYRIIKHYIIHLHNVKTEYM